MFCNDCGRRISQEEYIENGGYCMVCFDELIDEILSDEEDEDAISTK